MQITLGKLSEMIERAYHDMPNGVIDKGLADPHSYRGYYEQLGISRSGKISLKYQLYIINQCIFKQFFGYKGGEYLMDEHTPVWLACNGDCGIEITEEFIDDMLSKKYVDEEFVKTDGETMQEFKFVMSMTFHEKPVSANFFNGCSRCCFNGSYGCRLEGQEYINQIHYKCKYGDAGYFTHNSVIC